MKLPVPSPYEWTARLKPALFTLLPIFVSIAVWVPEVWTVLGALSGLLAACGVTALLAQVARHRGKRLEARDPEIGPRLSIALMRHGDQRIDRFTKGRYHRFLAANGHEIPSPEQEQTDPAEADERYRACMTWLLEATRDEKKFALLLRENIAYGFRRNLLAMKTIALPILIASLVVNAIALWSQWPDFETRAWAALGVEVALIAALIAWLFVINRDFWADASLSYGTRLLSCCDALGGAATKKAIRTAKAQPST
ncbi:MAG TPA: hypothetical protein VN158_12340 [Caulobacter sp.]|nr:hypothetical protein [Caulobacter sp.]